MLRFKMVGRDCDSIPTQYRTWIVPNTPDFTGQYYTGLKSGNNPFVDVSAYEITDDTVIADFDLPLGSEWRPLPAEQYNAFPVRKTLPDVISDSQLCILDGYAYMFGGCLTDKIYQANLNNPADWIDTGAKLPTPLYGSSLAIVGSHIYLFGGNDGYGPQNTIYSAPVNSPLVWTNQGHLLPKHLQYSSLGMANGSLYLFGGLSNNGASNVILTAATSNPLVWVDAGFHLPIPIYGSCIAQINNSWFMFGGESATNNPTTTIITAPITNPTIWLTDGYLPFQTAFSQFVTVGDFGYLFGQMVGAGSNYFTSIIRCGVSVPTVWSAPTNVVPEGPKTIPAVLSHSQLAVIYDRIWLFGGSGESAVFCCNQQIKYNYYDPVVVGYGDVTRTIFQNTDNADNPFQALCFPYWISDYH